MAAPPTDLQGITTLNSQAGTDLLPFSPSTIKAVLRVVAVQLPWALGHLAENTSEVSVGLQYLGPMTGIYWYSSSKMYGEPFA